MNTSDLLRQLSRLRIRPDSYSIGIGIPEADETYCLVEENGVWRVYYAERGKRGDLHEYPTEEEACDAFIRLLKSDESVWDK